MSDAEVELMGQRLTNALAMVHVSEEGTWAHWFWTVTANRLHAKMNRDAERYKNDRRN